MTPLGKSHSLTMKSFLTMQGNLLGNFSTRLCLHFMSKFGQNTPLNLREVKTLFVSPLAIK